MKAVPSCRGRQGLDYVSGVQPVPHLVGNRGTTVVTETPTKSFEFSHLTCSSKDWELFIHATDIYI